jgi:hypothetical protein
LNTEIQDESFLSRLRRSGLGNKTSEKDESTKKAPKAKDKRGGKKVCRFD